MGGWSERSAAPGTTFCVLEDLERSAENRDDDPGLSVIAKGGPTVGPKGG